jgi:hypothetical protein
MRELATRLLFPALAGLALVPAAADTPKVDSAKLAHCASIAAADERLACYDSVAVRRSAAPAPAAPAAAGTKATARATATAPATTTAAAPAAAATATQAGSAESKSFGLTEHKVASPNAPDSVHAQVAQVIEDRLGNVSVRLDNGQAWSLNESGVTLKQGDAVTIRHAAMGSFLLVAPDRRSYRARRLQ